MFDAPGAVQAATFDPDAPRWQEANHLGALCVFQPLELVREFATEYGAKDAMRTTITVVAGPGAGARYEDALVFGTVVIGQLQGKEGRSVLAKLAQGDKRPGKKAPWKLDGDSVTPEEAALAVKAMTMLAEKPATAAAEAPAAAAVAATPPAATAAPKAPWET